MNNMICTDWDAVLAKRVKVKVLKELSDGKANLALYKDEDHDDFWLRLSYGGTRMFTRTYRSEQFSEALSHWTLAEAVVKDLVACFRQETRELEEKLLRGSKILFGNVTEDDQA